MEYILWCDESEKRGRKFSNFYGGILVASSDKERIERALKAKKEELNLHGEIKWTKISATYLEKYIEYLDFFWQFVRSGEVKIRIMFMDNRNIRPDLTRQQKEEGFFILYYEFIKHAFGFSTIMHDPDTRLRIMFDLLPDTKEKCDRFKNYILGLNKIFAENNLLILKESIAEVTSHNHVLLQSMDIVLGAMDFRLNEKHLDKPEGQRNRGKKTIAKEKVYKHILNLIRDMYGYPFNIGISTGYKQTNTSQDRWLMPYRHWNFESATNTILF